MNKFLEDEYYEARGVPLLKPVLAEWIAVQREYTRQMGDDYSWNYSERASTGFLAVAAWQSKGVALEEWRTDKGTRSDPKNGRCDLYIYRHGCAFHIEAKHLWSRATSKKAKELVKRKLDQAITDAKRLQCPRHERFGILFVAPSYPIGKQSDMTSRIAIWLKSIYDIPHSAIAWLFLDRKKLKPDPKSNVIPGIVLLIRAAHQISK